MKIIQNDTERTVDLLLSQDEYREHSTSKAAGQVSPDDDPVTQCVAMVTEMCKSAPGERAMFRIFDSDRGIRIVDRTLAWRDGALMAVAINDAWTDKAKRG